MAWSGQRASVTTDVSVEETKVNDSGMVTLPADVRRRLDIGAGDKLRWTVDDEGTLEVEVVHERYGAFEDAQTASLGDDSLDSYDRAGYEPPSGEEE